MSQILQRDDPGYEAARRESVWARNVPGRRPDRIVRARTIDDVVAAVRDAARRGEPVGIKGSGHNYAATFLRDGGTLLDVSALAWARVDGVDGAHASRTRPGTGDGATAHVGPGIVSADLAGVLNAAGRAFPGGHHATVGIGGFLLGGGMGWNGRTWGEFACFGVEAVDVVCADGSLRTIDAERDPELFWAARGAGAGFPAVAVGFRLATRPLPRGIHAAGWTYRIEQAAEVAAWLQDDADGGRPSVERYAGFEGDPICRVRVIAFHDDPDDARAALRDLAATAPAPAGAYERIDPRPVDFARLYARPGITGERLRVVSDTAWSEDPVGAAAALAAQVAQAPDRRSFGMADFRAAPELPIDGAATVAARGFLSWAAKWDAPAQDEANGAWADATTAVLKPFRTGCYLNETDVIRHPEHAPLCFSATAWERLRAVRERYDPEGRFPAPW